MIASLLTTAIDARSSLFDAQHQSAFRLFNGFTEGCPDLAIDMYASTFLIHNYAENARQGESLVREAQEVLTGRLNWLRAGIVKTRNGATQQQKNGQLIFGDAPDRKIKEHGVWYAIHLTMNRDASFYLDTRNLRKWLVENSKGKSILNTFAYSGSFGTAALAGGANRVVQLDRNRQFLNLAKDSYALNGFPIRKEDFIASDFFPIIARFKHTKQFFDCVILDPPFFSQTSKGKVDQEHNSARLINKVRPLINDGGHLVAINNALYVSGREYMQTLESLCEDGYLKIKELIPVPNDFTGYPETRAGNLISDPAPFNHSTKIVILEVRRKQTKAGEFNERPSIPNRT